MINQTRIKYNSNARVERVIGIFEILSLYLRLKFLKVSKNIVKKIRILLVQNVDIIKTGFQEKRGIDFSRWF